MTSIVVAAGEVGSGTAGAAGGQHFSELTPRGVPGFPQHNVRESASSIRRTIMTGRGGGGVRLFFVFGGGGGVGKESAFFRVCREEGGEIRMVRRLIFDLSWYDRNLRECRCLLYEHRGMARRRGIELAPSGIKITLETLCTPS